MRKRILFITSRPIYPIVGGDQIRTAQCLQYLRSYFDVHEVVIGTTDDLPQPEKYDSYKYFKIKRDKIVLLYDYSPHITNTDHLEVFQIQHL